MKRLPAAIEPASTEELAPDPAPVVGPASTEDLAPDGEPAPVVAPIPHATRPDLAAVAAAAERCLAASGALSGEALVKVFLDTLPPSLPTKKVQDSLARIDAGTWTPKGAPWSIFVAADEAGRAAIRAEFTE
jgi:hypothetical protein